MFFFRMPWKLHMDNVLGHTSISCAMIITSSTSWQNGKNLASLQFSNELPLETSPVHSNHQIMICLWSWENNAALFIAGKERERNRARFKEWLVCNWKVVLEMSCAGSLSLWCMTNPGHGRMNSNTAACRNKKKALRKHYRKRLSH